MGLSTEKKNLLKEFTAKAAQRLHDKRQEKRSTLYIPSMETNIQIRNLQNDEIEEIVAMEGSEIEMNRYATYLGVCEPCLKDLAVELKEDGQIRKFTDVVDIFDFHEITEVTQEIMKLSGVNADKGMKVKVIDGLKN